MVATETETVADLIDRLGGVPAHRIRLKPAPGTATEADVIRWMDGPQKRLFELIDGVLVEKAVGTREGILASYISGRLWEFAEENNLGVVAGAGAPFRLRLGLVRFPDVSFFSWDRIPGDEFPNEAIAGLIPDLAAEVLSESNTPAEIELKLDHYFATGVRAAWVVDPKAHSAVLYTSRTRSKQIGIDGDLSAPKVLPGFRLPMRDLFGVLRRKKRKPR